MCEKGSGAFHIPKCLQEGGVNKMPIVSSSTSSKEGAFTFGELLPPFKVLRKPKIEDTVVILLMEDVFIRLSTRFGK